VVNFDGADCLTVVGREVVVIFGIVRFVVDCGFFVDCVENLVGMAATVVELDVVLDTFLVVVVSGLAVFLVVDTVLVVVGRRVVLTVVGVANVVSS